MASPISDRYAITATAHADDLGPQRVLARTNSGRLIGQDVLYTSHHEIDEKIAISIQFNQSQFPGVKKIEDIKLSEMRYDGTEKPFRGAIQGLFQLNV